MNALCNPYCWFYLNEEILRFILRCGVDNDSYEREYILYLTFFWHCDVLWHFLCLQVFRRFLTILRQSRFAINYIRDNLCRMTLIYTNPSETKGTELCYHRYIQSKRNAVINAHKFLDRHTFLMVVRSLSSFGTTEHLEIFKFWNRNINDTD